MERVSKRLQRIFFCNQGVPILRFETQQRYNLQEEVIFSRSELSSLIESSLDFFKTFDEARKGLQTQLPKPKTKLKETLLAHYSKDIIEYPNRKIRFSLRFQNNNVCTFPIKKFEIHLNQFIFTESVNFQF